MRRRKNISLITIIFIMIAFIYGTFSGEINKTFGLTENSSNNNIEVNNNNLEASKEVDGELSVYFLDVGQADSILIESNDEYMIIDGGNNNDGELLVQYFKSLGIDKFKYLVGTHPHEDHIGGLDDIIDSFNIGTIYLPDAITTTATFEGLLDSMEKKNLTYDVPEINSTFTLGDATLKVIYTGTDTSDLNNTSIVLKLVYGNNSFLFTGDATSETEEKIINQDIAVDVLKVGHHGSKYSTTNNFLDKVNPKYAIISVGENNIYNHPASSTIDKLKKRNISIYRTDIDGTILAQSDGDNISFSKLETNTNGG